MQQPLRHLAIIMDGNGRWAKQQGKFRMFGHQKGVDVAENTVKYAIAKNIEYLSLFVFSTENWKRPDDEVSKLMDLLLEFFRTKKEMLRDLGAKVTHLGRRDKLNSEVLNAIDDITEFTKNGSKINLQLCIDYGGRNEISYAVRQIVEQVQNGSIKIDDINEDTIAKNLYNPTVPDIDLLIRTGGESRISNFMLWQLAYTEIFMTDTLWPNLSEKDIDEAIAFYNSKERRFGGLK